MKWTREKIEWTFNGKTVAEYDTPSDLHQPMYLLVNLAVGGLWGGIPDDPSVFPADFLIDYIRVYDIER
jgi:beta-glucanase (GH16 family)